MTPPHWKQIQTVFFEATRIGGRRERAQFVRRACAGRPLVRTEVQCLLRCHDQDRAGFLTSGYSLAGKCLSHYQVIEEIGRGGVSAVYKARDMRLHDLVALKVLPPVLAADPALWRRFRREAQCLRALSDLHIVKFYGLGHDHGTRFIVMEYVPGITLDHLIPSSGLPLAKSLDYARQIAQALVSAHAADILHRDLKPANILIGSGGCVKLLDFGLAGPLPSRRTTRSQHTPPGYVLGTPSYMSPEQALGKVADARLDIFAFGSVFYEMLTGKRAFAKESAVETMNAVLTEHPLRLPRRIPRKIVAIVERCLQKEENRRYQTAKELQDALLLL